MQMTYRQETDLAQIGNERNEHFRAVSTPVYFSTAFRHDEMGLLTGYDYSRTGNPTRDVLEKSVALLEKGECAFATSSGMSAIQLVFSLFEKGDHIIASRDIYGGSYRLFDIFEAKYGLTFSYWNGDCLDELKESISAQTKAVFIETPTNPLMKETDIEQISVITKKHKLLCIVDNTLYTPYIQRPLELGADIVVHSATKYLAGHNDVLAGLVISKGKSINEELTFLHNSIGAVLGPLDCWNLIRGMKTLALRMDKHEKNAKEIVPILRAHPLVDEVLYPGRGGMLSFTIAHESHVAPFLKALKLFTFAESLGGVESFITYPKTQTHGDIPEEVRLSYGLSNCLLRVSVGIEHAADLVADLKQALEIVMKKDLVNIK